MINGRKIIWHRITAILAYERYIIIKSDYILGKQFGIFLVNLCEGSIVIKIRISNCVDGTPVDTWVENLPVGDRRNEDHMVEADSR